MLQKFFHTTIDSEFINSILYNKEIPTLDTISIGDYMVKGGVYIVRSRIVRCTKGGTYYGRLQFEENKVGYFSLGSAIGGVPEDACEYDILDSFEFGDHKDNITKRYIGNASYHNSYSHKYFGDYLRALRDLYKIDLMGMYNCFNYEFSDYFHLDNNNVVQSYNDSVKVLIVPIKFNKTYTIFIDCMNVLIKPVLINDSGLVKNDTKEHLMIESIEFEPYFKTKCLNRMSFKHPQLYRFDLKDTDEFEAYNIYKYRNYLNLVIQLPKTNKSSIVVLEGDYTETPYYIADVTKVDNAESQVLSDNLYTESALTVLNDNNTYAYCKKLVQYLCNNVITNRDILHKNIERIQDIINDHGQYKFEIGAWTNKLRYLIYKIYQESPDIFNKYDQMGFVDSDVEKYLMGRNVK